MTLKITIDHPIFQLSSKVQAVTQPFLNMFGLSYFQYLRCFDDGSIGLLTNNTSLMKLFQEAKNSPIVFSSFKNEHQKTQSYWFLWDEELPQVPVALVREKLKIYNGITLVRRSKHYHDMIAVAMATQPAHPGGIYLNKLKAIEEYINQFDCKHKDLLEILNKTRISLPHSYRDINYKKICLPTDRIPMLGKNGITYVTLQELTCLKLFCRGASFKKLRKHLIFLRAQLKPIY